MTEETKTYSEEVIKARFEEARELAVRIGTMMTEVDGRIAMAALILLVEGAVVAAPNAAHLKVYMLTFLKLTDDIVARLADEAGETVH